MQPATALEDASCQSALNVKSKETSCIRPTATNQWLCWRDDRWRRVSGVNVPLDCRWLTSNTILFHATIDCNDGRH